MRETYDIFPEELPGQFLKAHYNTDGGQLEFQVKGTEDGGATIRILHVRATAFKEWLDEQLAKSHTPLKTITRAQLEALGTEEK